jgi:hypothetical protein
MIAFRMERSNYDIVPKKVPSGKPTYIAMENGPVEIVDLPNKNEDVPLPCFITRGYTGKIINTSRRVPLLQKLMVRVS